MQKAEKAYKPLDASAMIETDVELDCLQLKGARDFYNDVVGILDKLWSVYWTNLKSQSRIASIAC